MSLLRFSLLVPVFAVVAYQLITYAFRVAYPVHSTGVIVISGASTGIGRDAAETLAKSGFHVFAGVRKDADVLSIQNTGISTLHPVILDVTQHDSVTEAIKTALAFSTEKKLPFVAVVNNAGISHQQIIEYHDMSDARNHFDINFFGALDMVQQSLPALRHSKGRIVMVSSGLGTIGVPTMGVYCASKFALEGLSDALRRELAAFGVSVSVVEPGYVTTAIFQKEAVSSEFPLYKTTGKREDATDKEIVSTYAHLVNEKMAGMRRLDEERASPVSVTTEAIVHAVSDQYPRTRYPVAAASGLPVWVLGWLDWVQTDRVGDFVLANA
jgi:short-subunit dehydrogenase